MSEIKTEFKIETNGSKINIYKSKLDNSCSAFMLDTTPFNKVIEEHARKILNAQHKLFLEAFGLPYSEQNIHKINKLLIASLNSSLKNLSEENIKLKEEIKELKDKVLYFKQSYQLALDLI